MRKLTAILLVFSLILCLCACGHKDKGDDERECGVYITVEADDVYTVSCGTEAGSESATPADGSAISAGETYHFDFAGDAANGKDCKVINYMICVYDKDFNIIAEESFEDDFSNMARIDIVVTEDHNIIYKDGNVNCGGRVVVSMSTYNDTNGLSATEALVSVFNNEAAGTNISNTLASYLESFKSEAEANRASYTQNTSGMGGEIPPFNMSHSFSVSRGDNNIVSFRVRDYVYLGTQEIETISGRNFDLNSGNELKLVDVFKDVDALKNHCTEYILISTTTDDGIYNEGFTNVIPELIADGNWYFNNEGLVIAASKGVISEGNHEFVIPYSEIEDYINEAYLPGAKDTMASGNISVCYADESSADSFNFVVNGDEPCSTGDLIISAGGNISNIGVYTVSYDAENNSYGLISQLLYCSDLRSGGAFAVKAALESTPNILVQYTTPYGTVKNNLLSVDENGNICILDPDGGEEGISIIDELPFDLDMNGDGKSDEISIKGGKINITSGSETGTYDTGLEEITVALLHDSDCDGNLELFVGGDMASDDYIVYCLKFDGKSIKDIPFDGEDFMFGSIVGFTANAINVNTRCDVLGTYAYVKEYRYDNGQFKAVDKSSYKVKSETYIVPNADLNTSEGGVIPAGTEVKVISSDFTSYVTVETKDGTSGTLTLATNNGEGGWLINGTPETELFQSLPYAD